MKKMKGVVTVESPPPPYAVYEDRRTRLRYQSLLQDYEDLQEETNAMRMKLQAAKQNKLILSAEVRFLRRQYRYLIQNPSPKPQPKKHDIPQPHKLKVQAATIPKSRKYNIRESILQPPASHLSSKERISNGVETKLQKTTLMFDLNQNAMSLCKKEPSFLNSAPVLDLNRKDSINNGKEATKKSITPFFDLNQISREEELLCDIEPMGIEEPKRVAQRGVNEEQHNDIKLSACRNIGNGSNRIVKRKISWQDQVALRV